MTATTKTPGAINRFLMTFSLAITHCATKTPKVTRHAAASNRKSGTSAQKVTSKGKNDQTTMAEKLAILPNRTLKCFPAL